MKLGQLLNVLPMTQRIIIHDADRQGYGLASGTMQEDYESIYEYADTLVTGVGATHTVLVDDCHEQLVSVYVKVPENKPEPFKIDDLVTVHWFLQYDEETTYSLGCEWNIPKYVSWVNSQVSGRTVQYLSTLEKVEVKPQVHLEGTPLEWVEYRIYIKD